MPVLLLRSLSPGGLYDCLVLYASCMHAPFLPSNNLTLSFSMVGSIGAIGVSLNLAPLLEVPSNALELLHHRQLAQCQCQCQSFPPQKLGVVPVVVTSGERKGLGRSKYFAPCIWAISSSQIVLFKLKLKTQGTHWCRPPRSSLSITRTCSATSTHSSRPG